MPNIIIYYFTGTGNTKIAAKAIENELVLAGYFVTLFELRADQENIPDPNDFDIIGFGYPIHAFNAPKFFLKYIKKLPQVSHRKAFIFKTSGEPFGFNRLSSWTLIHILKRKGFSVMMERHLLMPYNIMFRYQDALAKQMYLHTIDMAKVIANDIKNNRIRKIKFNLFYLPVMYLFRIQWFGARINSPLFYVKDDTCISCHLCESICPTSNITMKDGIPSFGKDCAMCMGCVIDCPVDAIRPGLISSMRINGKYPFQTLLGDEHVSADFINDQTKGYFKLFKKYYEKTQKEIDQTYQEINQHI